VARALALGGMMLAHYAGATRRSDPGWLQALDNAADGRAAPVFATLLGVGAGILAAKRVANRVFVARGVALLALGALIWPYTDRVYLILPHYGLLLAAVVLLRRLDTRALLPLAAVAFLIPSVVAATGDAHGLRSALQPDSYDEVLDIGPTVWNLVWTGGYPLVGWIGFVLIGLWLSRQRLGDAALQWRLLVVGAAVAATQPVLASIDASWAADFLDSSAHSNRTAWYVLSAASAVAVIAGCLLVAGVGRRLQQPLVHLGQLALSAYLLHLVVGGVLVWDWVDRSQPSLAAQVAATAAVFVALAALATAWRARFQRGPVEALLRAVSG